MLENIDPEYWWDGFEISDLQKLHHGVTVQASLYSNLSGFFLNSASPGQSRPAVHTLPRSALLGAQGCSPLGRSPGLSPPTPSHSKDPGLPAPLLSSPPTRHMLQAVLSAASWPCPQKMISADLMWHFISKVGMQGSEVVCIQSLEGWSSGVCP